MEFQEHIEQIEAKIGYVFRDKSLLEQAFTCQSFCNEQIGAAAQRQSNQVLEFYGDSILSAAIVSMLIRDRSRRYIYGISTDLDEGDLTNIKSRLSDKKHLSQSLRALGLQVYLHMGEGDKKLGIGNTPSVMEDLFESIIGAVYIDAGMRMEPVMETLAHMLDLSEYFHAQDGAVLKSQKNRLQEYCADRSRRLPPPVYETAAQEGPEHMRIYTRTCRIGERICGIGQGKNCKEADEAAARDALSHLSHEAGDALSCTPPAPQQNALLRLTSLAKKLEKAAPIYKDLGKKDDASALFVFACQFDNRQTLGEAPSKREAKRAAAQHMLHQLSAKKRKKPQKANT